MSEPRSVARAVEEILPGLFHYSVLDDRIETESDAYAVVEAGKVVLVDPLRLEDAAFERRGTVEAILLGAPAHQRAAWRWRRRTGARVYAPSGSEGLEEPADLLYGDGDRLPGGLRAVHAPGPGEAHHVLYLASGPGVLFLTDLVTHGAGRGVRFLPDEHMTDRTRARRSARRLLEYRFDILCFGHGRPVLKGGRQAFEELLRQDGGAEE
jgi:glyoxylase-like metal-dependent hydrolase (beta-lactamase superfamily II)